VDQRENLPHCKRRRPQTGKDVPHGRQDAATYRPGTTAMIPFKQEWTVESAMEILHHPTVDSQVWASAVEWLLMYGPPEIRELLQQASAHAMGTQFPELKPQRYGPDGSPCYDLAELARTLGISEDEARELLRDKERKHGVQHGFSEDDTTTLQ